MAQLRKNLVDKVFGRWTVLAFVGRTLKRNRARWQCRCVCGQEKVVSGDVLRNGSSQSCGCLRMERVTKDGRSRHPLYKTWNGIKQRCENPQVEHYFNYGGRGIKNLFSNPFEIEQAIGLRPSPRHSIDRIDNEGNYAPNNVRWATDKEQSNNTRRKQIIDFSDTEIQTEFLRRNLHA